MNITTEEIEGLLRVEGGKEKKLLIPLGEGGEDGPD